MANYSEVGGENAELLRALINNESYDGEITSRNSAILDSIINGTEYNDPPQSEIEALLLELKEKGGGGMSYSYHYSNDNKLCVRESADGVLRWYFLGFHTTGISEIPEELAEYASINQNAMLSFNYESDLTTKNGYCGFYGNTIRLWSLDLVSNIEGDMWGIVDTGIAANSIEERQDNGVVADPKDDK